MSALEHVPRVSPALTKIKRDKCPAPSARTRKKELVLKEQRKCKTAQVWQKKKKKERRRVNNENKLVCCYGWASTSSKWYCRAVWARVLLGHWIKTVSVLPKRDVSKRIRTDALWSVWTSDHNQKDSRDWVWRLSRQTWANDRVYLSLRLSFKNGSIVLSIKGVLIGVLKAYVYDVYERFAAFPFVHFG